MHIHAYTCIYMHMHAYTCIYTPLTLRIVLLYFQVMFYTRLIIGNMSFRMLLYAMMYKIKRFSRLLEFNSRLGRVTRDDIDIVNQDRSFRQWWCKITNGNASLKIHYILYYCNTIIIQKFMLPSNNYFSFLLCIYLLFC